MRFSSRDSMARLFGQRVDPLGQAEVQLRQPTFAMRRQNQTDLVVTNIDIGMMLFVLSHFDDGVYKINSAGKIIELEGAFDVLLLQFPFRDFLQADFCFIPFDQISHNRTTSNTPKSFCNGESKLFFRDCRGLQVEGHALSCPGADGAAPSKKSNPLDTEDLPQIVG